MKQNRRFMNMFGFIQVKVEIRSSVITLYNPEDRVRKVHSDVSAQTNRILNAWWRDRFSINSHGEQVLFVVIITVSRAVHWWDYKGFGENTIITGWFAQFDVAFITARHIFPSMPTSNFGGVGRCFYDKSEAGLCRHR